MIKFIKNAVTVATPDCLAIVDDEISLRLSPNVLVQIEQDMLNQNPVTGLGADRNHKIDIDNDIIYKLNSQELLQVLASSVGIASLRQGAIVIWTYYFEPIATEAIDNEVIDNLPNSLDSRRSPILRTVIDIDGKLSQKVCQDILKHPLGDRILKAHSYIVGQISRQFITAIADYVEIKLRPFAIAIISMVTVFAWCEPLRKLGEKLHLTEAVVGNCWMMIIAAPITVLLIWWINSNLPFQRSRLPKFAGKFDQRWLQKWGKVVLNFLEGRILRTLAIFVITILFFSWFLVWLTTTFAHFPIDGQLNLIIRNIESYIEPYLPIALISLRKLIVNTLGKIFFRYSFFVKLIFGRFIR